MSMTQAQANKLGVLISRARSRAGVSTRELAARVGVHHSFIAYLEQGRYLDPASQTLAQIADVLSIPTARLDRVTKGAVSAGLPTPQVYFRSKLALSPEETERVMKYIERMRRAA